MPALSRLGANAALGRRPTSALHSFAVSTLVHAVVLVAMGLVEHAYCPPRRGNVARLGHDARLDGPALSELPALSAPLVGPRPPVVQQRIELRGWITCRWPMCAMADPKPIYRFARARAPAALAKAREIDVGFAGTEGALSGRSGSLKGELLDSEGGNQSTEEAVTRGLSWLAAHQLPNGSWRFNHQGAALLGARAPIPAARPRPRLPPRWGCSAF